MIWGQSARRLAHYKSWANERTFKDVCALSEEQLNQKRDSLFGSIVHTLNHNYVIDAIFKAHLLAEPHAYLARNTRQPPLLNDLVTAQQEMDTWWSGWAAGLTQSTAEEIVEFDFVDGGPGAMSRGDMLVHVVNHNSYHRGFVAEMLYQISVTPSATDLPVFSREFPNSKATD